MHVIPARVGQDAAKAERPSGRAERALTNGRHGHVGRLPAQMAAVPDAADMRVVTRTAPPAGKAQLAADACLQTEQ